MIGSQTAEEIKLEIGSAYPLREEVQAEIRGRDLVTGLPRPSCSPPRRSATPSRSPLGRSSTPSRAPSTRRRPSWPPTSWTAASCSPAAARCCRAWTSACARDRDARARRRVAADLRGGGLRHVPRGVRGARPRQAQLAPPPLSLRRRHRSRETLRAAYRRLHTRAPASPTTATEQRRSPARFRGLEALGPGAQVAFGTSGLTGAGAPTCGRGDGRWGFVSLSPCWPRFSSFSRKTSSSGSAGEQRLELAALERLPGDQDLADPVEQLALVDEQVLAVWCASSMMRRISSSIWRATSSE